MLCSKKHGIDLSTPEAKRRRVMTLYSGHYALEQARSPMRLHCWGCSSRGASHWLMPVILFVPEQYC